MLFRSRFLEGLLDGAHQKCPEKTGLCVILPPKGRPKRFQNATSIFNRFCIDFGTRFGRLLVVSACFLALVRADVCRFLAFNQHAVSGRCPWDAAVSLCVYNDFWEPFWFRFSDLFVIAENH